MRSHRPRRRDRRSTLRRTAVLLTAALAAAGLAVLAPPPAPARAADAPQPPVPGSSRQLVAWDRVGAGAFMSMLTRVAADGSHQDAYEVASPADVVQDSDGRLGWTVVNGDPYSLALGPDDRPYQCQPVSALFKLDIGSIGHSAGRELVTVCGYVGPDTPIAFGNDGNIWRLMPYDGSIWRYRDMSVSYEWENGAPYWQRSNDRGWDLVVTEPGARKFALDAEDNLYVLTGGEVVRFAADGARTRTVLGRLPSFPGSTPLTNTVSADGQYVYVGLETWSSNGLGKDYDGLWRMPLTGGTPVRILGGGGIEAGDATPVPSRPTVSVEALTPTQISATVSGRGIGRLTYTLRAVNPATGLVDRYVQKAAGQGPLTLTGLDPSVPYRFTATATNFVGTSLESVPLTAGAVATPATGAADRTFDFGFGTGTPPVLTLEGAAAGFTLTTGAAGTGDGALTADPGLPPGVYHPTLRAHFPAGPDLVQVLSLSVGAVVNDSESFAVANGWAQSGGRGLGDLGDDVRTATADGATLTYGFRGTAVAVIGERGPTQGDLEIAVDGVRTTVGTRSDALLSRQTVYQRTGLDPGVPHFVQVTKRSGATATVDAFAVRAVRDQVFNDTEVPVVSYQGPGWYHLGPGRGLGDWADDVHFTKSPGGYLSYSFTGSGVDVIGERAWDQGKLEVTVYAGNGVSPVRPPVTVNTLSAERRSQSVIASVQGLPYGDYRITVTNPGNKVMTVDRFDVYQRLTLPPPTVSSPATAVLTGAGASFTVTTRAVGGGTVRLTQDNPTLPAGLAFRDNGDGTATVTRGNLRGWATLNLTAANTWGSTTQALWVDFSSY